MMKDVNPVCELERAIPPTCGGLNLDRRAETGVDEPSLRCGFHTGEIARFGARSEFVLRIAITGADRLACWHLVYQEYCELGYVQPQALEYRYSLHDALPDTATFLIEHAGEAIATVSVFPNSPLGLPADEIYRLELDALRKAGRDLVEIGRLTIRRDYVNNRLVLMNLLDALSLHARCVRQATDLIVTINPSHARFYERSILFERIGEQKHLGSVCGAPAVLLRLDLDLERRVRRYVHDNGPAPEIKLGAHTAYPHVSNLASERIRVSRMRQAQARPESDFIYRHFVSLRPLIPHASPMVQAFFQQCYPGLGLEWPAQDIAAL